MSRLWIVLALVACGDNLPPPVDVMSGRMTAHISLEPAQITLLVDGAEVWSTESGYGDGTPPHGFAAISSKSVTILEEFGSFKFTEDPTHTSVAIDRPARRRGRDRGWRDVHAVRPAMTRVGTGALSFHHDAIGRPAGFPPQVRILLTADSGDSVSLSAPCPATEHVVGLGGQSFDVDHRGQHVALWVQEDGIGKFPDPDDRYEGVWFLNGRPHSTHTPMPMMLSSRGYALAVDTNARTIFDLGEEHTDSARFEAWEHTLDLQVFIGDGPRDATIAGAAARDAVGNMIAWVGKPPRPPSTVFAPWVDAIFGSANVRAVAQALRD